MEEQYVSFDVAKLLSEHGFDEPCKTSYSKLDKKLEETAISDWGKANQYKAPTQSLAMRWLREEKLRFITMDVDYLTDSPRYGWHIEDLSIMDDNMEYVEDRYQTYEEACEAAIKYCLENIL